MKLRSPFYKVLETCELREYKTTSLKQMCAHTKLNPSEKSPDFLF